MTERSKHDQGATWVQRRKRFQGDNEAPLGGRALTRKRFRRQLEVTAIENLSKLKRMQYIANSGSLGRNTRKRYKYKIRKIKEMFSKKMN